jgi:hypothetical protein
MTQEPIAEVVIPRGKYIGKRLSEGPASEAGYFHSVPRMRRVDRLP